MTDKLLYDLLGPNYLATTGRPEHILELAEKLPGAQDEPSLTGLRAWAKRENHHKGETFSFSIRQNNYVVQVRVRNRN